MTPAPWQREKKDVTNQESIVTHKNKKIHVVRFEKRAPRPIRKEICKFAEKTMGTPDLPPDIRCNQHTWSQGIRHVPPQDLFVFVLPGSATKMKTPLKGCTC